MMMKALSSLLSLACLLLATPVRAAGPEAEVLGIDGSHLKGQMTDLTNGALILDSADFFAPSPLLLNQILQVNLPPRQEQGGTDHIATITLSNGDVLRGQLIQVTDKTIGLHTWYAGDLTFHRSMVDKLDIQDLPGRIYAGPSGEEDWAQSDPKKWEVGASQLTSHGSGSISRKLKLPSKAHFSFDLSWRQNPRFHFRFYTDQIGKEKVRNGFDLNCQSRYVYLRKTKDDRSINIVGTADVREFSQARTARLDIFVNRETGLVRLKVNDRVIMDWTDPDPGGRDLSGGIHFVNDDSSAMRVSRIEVTEWDGVVEDPGPVGDPDEEDSEQPHPAGEPAPPTRIRLRNNDEIDGETTGIENGIVKMKTTFGDVEIPVSRLRTFSLHTPDERKDTALYEVPRLYADNVRAWFPDGSRVTLRLKDIRDGRLQGYSQPFGDADFELGAFEKLEFNLYREGLEDLRGQEHW